MSMGGARAARLLLVALIHAGLLWALWAQAIAPQAAAPPPAIELIAFSDPPARRPPPPPPPPPPAATRPSPPAPQARSQPQPSPPPPETETVAPEPAPAADVEPVTASPVDSPSPPAGTSLPAGGGSAAGSGAGQGSGATGSGGGGNPAVRARRIAGGIDGRDYPREARRARRSGVTIAHMDVDAGGQVSACRIVASSGEPELDATTCRLILARFRYAPARNAAGDAVPDIVGWRQEWMLGDRDR